MSAGAPPQRQIHLAIVGGGLIGLSIAWRLAQRGYRVSLFEKGNIGQEASWAGAGMLAPGGEFSSTSALTSLALESRGLYRAFVRELEAASGIAIDYQECGALDLAYGGEEQDELEKKAQAQAALGIESKAVDKRRVKAFWPRVETEGLTGARFYPNDAIVNPRDLIMSLRRVCAQSGVELEEGVSVSQVALEGGGVYLQAWGERIQADAVVIAAGAWSSEIAVLNAPALPVARPIRGHLIGFDQPDQTCNTIVRRGRTYLLQRANGLLIAGASVEEAGWNREIDPEIAASLRREAGFLLPHLRETEPSHVWTGFRPGGAELYLGAWHSERIYLAYGHYRNGILLAPVTANKTVEEISANWQRP